MQDHMEFPALFEEKKREAYGRAVAAARRV